ncbi:carboxypeptidase-like regulatory domain-containing protein [Pedobacter gandavensis]|uniref:carboxypeptidase-like regulatory domain-containing protein n=1 Tax=Pedobacter gandavensis TaxID=2679963 RepID=UPI0039776BF2
MNGTVKDANGQPFPGVTVLIKGSKKGSSTNGDGKFTIKAQSTDVLVFSLVGYQSKEIAVADKSTINVSLKVEETVLNEIAVTDICIKQGHV